MTMQNISNKFSAKYMYKGVQIYLLLIFNLFVISHLLAEPVNDKESKFGWQLTDSEKRKLLEISRATLESVVKSNVLPSFNQEVLEFSSKFVENAGVFVTLKKNHNLRGCIGNIFPYQPMCQSVIRNTINAALYDRRFTPVNSSEIDNIEIEISVLSKIEKIDSYLDFKNGYHGIIIKKDESSAVFLPQVANEQNWSRNETLSHLCVKAGLSKDAWKDSDMEFSVFTAEVFNENTVSGK